MWRPTDVCFVSVRHAVHVASVILCLSVAACHRRILEGEKLAYFLVNRAVSGATFLKWSVYLGKRAGEICLFGKAALLGSIVTDRMPPGCGLSDVHWAVQCEGSCGQVLWAAFVMVFGSLIRAWHSRKNVKARGVPPLLFSFAFLLHYFSCLPDTAADVCRL